jgi:DNA helicase II / ATP-dependent DNA helicase PcrA
MTPNPQQSAVIRFATHGLGSCNVIARAGCGKTSLLVSMAEEITRWNPRLRLFFGAFNKAIASELQGRIPYRSVTVKTMHAIGLQCFRLINPRFEINDRKVSSLAKLRHQFDKKSSGVVTAAVGYAKQMGLGLPYDGLRSIDDPTMWREILDAHDLNDEIPADKSDEAIIESCAFVYRTSLEMCKDAMAQIDFDDMILAPLLLASNEDQFRQFDWVMIDELQDQNHIRRVLAERILRRGGRFCGVGDDRQAIYAFAGADSDSMERTKQYMRCTEFPLNVTYRCPKSVVRLAQTWVPDFTAHEGNPEGTVITIHHSEFWKQDFDQVNDVILCRNRRPLVGISKRLRKMGIQCVVEGGNGRGLIALAEKWGDDITIEQLSIHLSEYRVTEVRKHMDKGREDKAEAVNDRVDILMDLMDGLQEEDSVAALVRRIEITFDDTGKSNLLKLCTVHRSKGREWKRVFLVGRNRYMPSYYAAKAAEAGHEEALKQEENLEYVAVTRTKDTLVEVIVPDSKPRKNGEEQEEEWWEV